MSEVKVGQLYHSESKVFVFCVESIKESIVYFYELETPHMIEWNFIDDFERTYELIK